ncbi:MAG TPA: hypothetical protein ENN80_12740 [Candidatus Hydrogenedentes bacterium]|nr:hypothetical protein [Candidatus Hydrogenedentota bacterium]
MKTSIEKAFRFLASYGFSVVLLLLLALLTLLGTLEQVDQGLYAVKEKYFASLFVVHDFFGLVPVPLPGVYLLLILASVNLFCGGVVRARKGWRHWGLLVAHVGILLLLAGAFVGFEYSQRGHVTLYEGEQTDAFVSYEAWEIALANLSHAPPATEYVIPAKAFEGAKDGRAVTFYAATLPFDLTVTDYARNAQPVPADASSPVRGAAIDGFRLATLEPERDAERNVPGVCVALTSKGTGTRRQGILWGMAHFPWSVRVDGDDWSVDLRRITRPLPFTVRLDAFTREFYPGTDMPKSFISDVTTIENGIERGARISMNRPLRHRGYTFYQASWGPANARPGEPLYSSLAVSRNPAEQLPVYACSVICLGLAVHFCVKLGSYLRTQSRRPA